MDREKETAEATNEPPHTVGHAEWEAAQERRPEAEPYLRGFHFESGLDQTEKAAELLARVLATVRAEYQVTLEPASSPELRQTNMYVIVQAWQA